MKKNLSRILSYTASAVAMSAILAVIVPAGLFGQSGRVFAEGSTTPCPYGGAGCIAAADGEHAHDVTIGGSGNPQIISGGTFTGNHTITVKSGGEITGGTFGNNMSSVKVTVEGGTISGGTFNNKVTVTKDSSGNEGEITGGTFNDNIVVENGGVISGVTGTSTGGQVAVNTGGKITGGTFSKQVELNGGTITGGTFENSNTIVTSGTIKDGIFYDFNVNNGTIEGGTFFATCGPIGNYQESGTTGETGKITGGTFYCKVVNGNDDTNSTGNPKQGSISGGYFWGEVENALNGTISNGSFYGTVTNRGNITGGGFVTLPAGLQEGGNIRIIPYPSSGSASGASEAAHTHSYSWVTVQEATVGQDGIEEYRCSCGDVQERCVIPASMVFVKGLYGAIKDAPQNGTATFDSGRLYTISDYVIKKFAERSDVTTVITFEYQNQSYQMTIPAGADYTALLADQYYFYGYFYFANVVGAAIEAL